MARSLQLSPKGITQARSIEASNRRTQLHLAEEVGLSRATVANFFAGKPVDRVTFVKLCEALHLDWHELVESFTSTNKVTFEGNNLDTLVQESRKRVKSIIDTQCSSMRVLDMTHPLELLGIQGIYTNVNILERISGRRRLGLTKLLEEVDTNGVNRFGLSQLAEARVPGLEAANRYSNLVIFGKPGAGKTTFLKYLAMKCLDGQFQADHVPVFIALRDFAEVSHKHELLEFITTRYGEELKSIIQYGKALILLDGLDEIREQDAGRVLNQIRQLSISFSNNRFIVTCRIAAIDYVFERFVEVEVADFNLEQVNTFAINWFKNKGSSKAKRFIHKLNENRAVRELATNPLLLTLLCLVFENSGDFPLNHSELYEEGVNIMLKKWDSQRNIERRQIYKELSLRRKVDLLSHIAWKTFKHGEYFFRRRDVEQYISEYLCNLTDSENDKSSLELNSSAVLKSIEVQHSLIVERAHNIYAFSHLTFHEYFTARNIVSNFTSYMSDQEILEILVSHISDPRWQEVFILVASMLPCADKLLLLIKETIDKILAQDSSFQEILVRGMDRASSISNPSIETVWIRYFLFSRYFNLPFYIPKKLLDSKRNPISIAVATKIDLPIMHLTSHGSLADNSLVNFGEDKIITLSELLDTSFANSRLIVLEACQSGLGLSSNESSESEDSEVRELLQKFNTELEISSDNQEMTDNWRTKLQGFANKLISVDNTLGNIHPEERILSKQQKKLLIQHYHANNLLMNCLQSDCYVSRTVRQEIYDTLLLPINRN